MPRPSLRPGAGATCSHLWERLCLHGTSHGTSCPPRSHTPGARTLACTALGLVCQFPTPACCSPLAAHAHARCLPLPPHTCASAACPHAHLHLVACGTPVTARRHSHACRTHAHLRSALDSRTWALDCSARCPLDPDAHTRPLLLMTLGEGGGGQACSPRLKSVQPLLPLPCPPVHLRP